MIVGAGYAGLLAAHIFPRMEIVDAAPGPRCNHQALMRMRTPAVSELTGIPFRKVTVRKGIWYRGEFRAVTMQLANMYSRKVLGTLADRSIWHQDPVVRYLPPDNFYDRLVESFDTRICWNAKADFGDASRPLISTAPMPTVLFSLGVPTDCAFRSQPIQARRFRLAIESDVHQTVYFPDPSYPLYRATLSGQLLTCEFAGLMSASEAAGFADVDSAFCLSQDDYDAASFDRESSQPIGKLAPLPEGARRAHVVELTDRYNIYSLGRFATWRNILLDDVVHDAHVIKQLITSASNYNRKLHYTKP